MPDYTFPGASQRSATVERIRNITSENDLQTLLQSLIRDMDRDQAKWDRAVNTRYTHPFQIRLRNEIWQALHGCPYFETVDTMEVASMRCRVFDVLDAIWPLVSTK